MKTMKTMKKNIFMKLFLTYIGISIASFVVNSAIFYLLYQNDLKQQRLDAIALEQLQIEKTLELAYSEDMSQESRILALQILNEGAHRALYFYDQDGQPLYTITNEAEQISVDQVFVDKALQGQTIMQHIRNDNKRMFLVAAPVTNYSSDHQEKAMIILYLGFHQMQMKLQNIFLLAGAIAIVMSACILYYLSKRLTAPLREMNEVAMEYAKGNFDKRLKITSGDEIAQLGKTFNHMATELNSLDLMRKEFVANVSHDLRSPLTSINGFVGALLDGTIPVEKQPYYLKLMKEETERLIKLVNELLDIARMEAGQLTVQPVQYNILEQIRKSIAKMEPEFVKKNLTVQLPDIDQLDFEVYADPDRMDQVFGNLIQNAVYFSPQSGTIELSIKSEGNHVEIAISDEGPGINTEDLQHIWDRFYKADKARSKKVGTGIGLSIVKHIIDLHGAKIQVQSEVGLGTTFTVILPLVKSNKAQ